MRLRDTIPPWPPRIELPDDEMRVGRLVLHDIIAKNLHDAVTPHLCLELKDKTGWFYYSHIFSEDPHFLKKVKKVLRGNLGKTIHELGNVECCV